ncbi:MAG: hypothetical protein RIS45_508 [Planctomycetota bacterium]
MKLGAMATVVSAVSAMAVGGQAEAQAFANAVEWKSSAGGNGHWYSVQMPTSAAISWSFAQSECTRQGGHLASITSGQENAFVAQVAANPVYWTVDLSYLTYCIGPWLGGFQPADAAEPSGGWTWVTGETWGYQNWFTEAFEPNNGCGGEDYLHFLTQGSTVPSAWWNDSGGPECPGPKSYVIEWSADCNNDGIVDYGQCHNGSLPDYNGNNIPDCCEQGTTCVVGNFPVQWRTQDGGNGHWYQCFPRNTHTSVQSLLAPPEAPGASGATLQSQSENAFAIGYLASRGSIAAWIGLYRSASLDWIWTDGSALGFADWGDSSCGAGPYPNNAVEAGMLVKLYNRVMDCGWNWDDIPSSWEVHPILVEWSADCNNDGIIDYGQILQGQLADVDANGVPDICEPYAVPREYPTIQAAIDAVPTGVFGWVSVAAGTYNESFSLNGKNVIVRGAPNNATILVVSGLATSLALFACNEPATAGVENLVFRNGTVGSRLFPKATFTVGGAVYGLNSAAFIRNCRFEQNEADFGGGVYLLRCDAAVEGCVFAGNEALTDGGGFFAYECSGSVRATDFTANICGASGSGNGGAFKTVGARAAGGVFLLEDCSLTANISGVDGAAVHHFENSALGVVGALRIVDCQITGNTSVVGAGGVRHDGPQSALVLAGTTNVCTNLRSNISGPYLIDGLVTVCDCNADITGDGLVNGGDLGVLLSAWGVALPSGDGDVNHDGLVNGSDLSMVLSSWGACY